MDRADLIALASPPCHECGESVQRVETRWHLDDDRTWRPGPAFLDCPGGGAGSDGGPGGASVPSGGA